MKNLSTVIRAVILLCSVTAFSCLSNLERYDNRFVTKMQQYVTDTSATIKTGGIRMIPISTSKGIFKVWTKTIGNSGDIKVLLLGGGPGVSHQYLQCLESYFPGKAISFIYYDPLGSGNSDNPKDTMLWDLPRYTDEVEQVRSALDLNKNNFYLFGHGWAGMVAIEYALKYQENLKALIVSNMVSNVKLYNSYAEQLIAQDLDSNSLDRVRQLEARLDYNNPAYQTFRSEFNSKHLCSLPVAQWQGPIQTFFAGQNDSIQNYMKGSAAFKISGKLAEWNRSADLKRITVPTLVIGAKYDVMDPKHMQWMASQVKNGTYLYCKNGSHLSMYDDQQAYMDGLTDFIYQNYRKDHFWDIYF